MATTLSILHNLFLTKEQRYDWHAGKEIDVIGVSVPVWYAKGQTSEPAVEVFCTYHLRQDDEIFIKFNKDSYTVNLPKKAAEIQRIPDDIWESLSAVDKDNWYLQNEPGPSIANLLDYKDGGCEWVAFRQHSKIKKNKKTLNVIHFMEIKNIEELLETLS